MTCIQYDSMDICLWPHRLLVAAINFPSTAKVSHRHTPHHDAVKLFVCPKPTPNETYTPCRRRHISIFSIFGISFGCSEAAATRKSPATHRPKPSDDVCRSVRPPARRLGALASPEAKKIKDIPNIRTKNTKPHPTPKQPTVWFFCASKPEISSLTDWTLWLYFQLFTAAYLNDANVFVSGIVSRQGHKAVQ